MTPRPANQEEASLLPPGKNHKRCDLSSAYKCFFTSASTSGRSMSISLRCSTVGTSSLDQPRRLLIT